MKKDDKDRFINSLEDNPFQLCDTVFDFCKYLKSSLGPDDGFRRQAIPLLMYRYFADMLRMFLSVKKSMKKNGYFALVVGHNKTTLGGTKIDIDTPDLLKHLAMSIGWIHFHSYPLQTYHRYEIHSKNAVNEETLLILKNG